jgi:alkylation response protein AidB-like acyl-CoA dehydrogenase
MHLTTEQEDLRAAVRGLIDHAASAAPDGGLDEAAAPAASRLWQRLCAEIGVAGLLIPDRFGGAGAGPVEVAVVMEELGRSLTPSPMLGSAVLATSMLLESGDEDACRRLLPGLADGSSLAALAWTSAQGHWDPVAVACTAAGPGTRDDGGENGYQLGGEAHYVLDGDLATVLLIPARLADGQTALFEAGPGEPEVTRTALASVDQTRSLATVRLNGAAGRRIGGAEGLSRARDAACIALAAEQAGAAAGALARTVEYAKVRVQFGRPIGSFQALQHRMADMHVLAESARSLAYSAAQAAGQNAPDLALRAAAAKAYCSEALQQVTAEMIQLHGAIGMTWEHPAHRYFKRGHGAAMLLGRPADHRARIAAEVIDRSPPAV